MRLLALLLMGLVAFSAAHDGPHGEEPIAGASCSTVTPGQNEACCISKVQEGEEDDWCRSEYSYLYNAPGSTCDSVAPEFFDQCCADKADAGEADPSCPAPPPSGGNSAAFPWMAYIESPKAPEGKCAGSLVAPGYVLTAAQCVFKDGEAASPGDVKVWVDGVRYEVEIVLVNSDKAQFEEFTNPKSENSWDVAMLALAADSNASYVALPLADVPKLGDWLDTTAWKDASVEIAKIPVWDGCPPGWADEFCAGGGGFLSDACPNDKGAPAFVGSVQVGLTSGPGCDGAAQDYGYYLKLADKGILEQITVWLNHRGAVGQDENIQAWLVEANTYLYE